MAIPYPPKNVPYVSYGLSLHTDYYLLPGPFFLFLSINGIYNNSSLCFLVCLWGHLRRPLMYSEHQVVEVLFVYQWQKN